MLKNILFIAFTMFLFSVASGLRAQAVCTGSGCSAFPAAEQNDLFGQFQYNYLNTLVNDMSRASLSAALSGYPGVAEIDGAYHMGISIPAGYKEQHDVWIGSPSVQ